MTYPMRSEVRGNWRSSLASGKAMPGCLQKMLIGKSQMQIVPDAISGNCMHSPTDPGNLVSVGQLVDILELIDGPTDDR